MGRFLRREPPRPKLMRDLYTLGSLPTQTVKFTLRAIPQVSWNKLKAEPAVKFKVQTLNDD